MIKDKFVVKVYGKPIIQDGEEYRNCLDCLSSNSEKIIKQYTKQFREKYPDNEIVVKERIREGWIEMIELENKVEDEKEVKDEKN
jgi:hypothetical protein